MYNQTGVLLLRAPCLAPQPMLGTGHCAWALGEGSERKPGIQRDTSPPKEELLGLLHQMALINQECGHLKG